MTISILICTIDDGINKIYLILQSYQDNVRYIVSHQYRGKKIKDIPKELIKREDVTISQIPGFGISRNRNNALSIADGDIAVIADDDVTYLPNTFQTIEEVFKNDPDLDVACFKIKTLDGENAYKQYPDFSYSLNKIRHHSISSIEIAFRPERIKEKKIFFDERFGIGNNYLPAGEETIFIHDCIKSGLKVVYYPYDIVTHTFSNTIRKLPPYDNSRPRVVAAVDACKNPFLAIPKAFGRTIKYLPELIHNKRNPLKFICSQLDAILYIFFTRKS